MNGLSLQQLQTHHVYTSTRTGTSIVPTVGLVFVPLQSQHN